jgi:hypothetical protein
VHCCDLQAIILFDTISVAATCLVDNCACRNPRLPARDGGVPLMNTLRRHD